MSDDKVEEGPATPAIQAILDQCKDELADRVGVSDTAPLVAKKYRRFIKPNGDSTYSIRVTRGQEKILLNFEKSADGQPKFVAHAYICEMYRPDNTEVKLSELLENQGN